MDVFICMLFVYIYMLPIMWVGKDVERRLEMVVAFSSSHKNGNR